MKTGLILALCFSLFAVSSPSNTWNILSKIKFDVRFDEKLEDVVLTPKPTKAIKKLIGKQLTIQGFRSVVQPERNSDSKDNSIYLCRYEDTPYGCFEGYDRCLLINQLRCIRAIG